MKVAVLGAAGGIGQALALLLKTQLPSGSELSLYDIAPVTPGVAVDLSHIPTAVKIKGFSGEDATPALEGADVVLISAGVARKPGMDRSDLFNVNAGIVKNLVQQVAKTCPKACIGIITNPVNTTVAIAAEVLRWLKRKPVAGLQPCLWARQLHVLVCLWFAHCRANKALSNVPTLKATVSTHVSSLNRCCWVKTAWKSVNLSVL